ncbi:MAG: Ig-like domain-containing protein [Gemmatimonadaceae bacterium]
MKNLQAVGFRLAAMSVLLFQFACGGSDGTTAPPVATTLTANSATSLSGTAGAAVATPPSVLVRDQNGNPMAGVPVAFNVATGGGFVTGAASVTNASGVATVGSWTLGTSVGTNTVVASTGNLTPVTFTATASAGAPASISKTAGDAQTAVAGSAVAISPSVTVKDANGNPVSGASVTFSVTSGGGTVTSGSQTTNSSGVATVAGWTLGTTAGPNSLSATSGSLSPAVFTATGTAGPAAVVIKTAGDNQSANSGTAVSVPPSVTVRDANGNAVAGVTVIFAVASGGGTLTGGSQVTNASGVATVGSWTLGTAGTNTLTATAGTLPPVTFTATATNSPNCSVATPHTLGTTSSGDLATADCRLSGGQFIDFFSTSVSPAGAYAFSESASGFDSYLYLYGPDGWVVAINDDESDTSLNSRMKVLVPSANYILGASSYDPGSTGAYTVSSQATSEAVSGCEEVFIARGVSTNQTLQTTDCLVNNLYSDDMVIFLRAGQSVTISMNSTTFDAYLELYDRNGLVASNDNKDQTTTNAQIVYTIPTTDFYLIVPTSRLNLTTGAYTLTIQ